VFILCFIDETLVFDFPLIVDKLHNVVLTLMSTMGEQRSGSCWFIFSEFWVGWWDAI